MRQQNRTIYISEVQAIVQPLAKMLNQLPIIFKLIMTREKRYNTHEIKVATSRVTMKKTNRSNNPTSFQEQKK